MIMPKRLVYGTRNCLPDTLIRVPNFGVERIYRNATCLCGAEPRHYFYRLFVAHVFFARSGFRQSFWISR